MTPRDAAAAPPPVGLGLWKIEPSAVAGLIEEAVNDSSVNGTSASVGRRMSGS